MMKSGLEVFKGGLKRESGEASLINKLKILLTLRGCIKRGLKASESGTIPVAVSSEIVVLYNIATEVGRVDSKFF